MVLLTNAGATTEAPGETGRTVGVPARATAGGAEGATVEATAAAVEFARAGKEGIRAGLGDEIRVLLLAVEAGEEL